MTQEKVNRIIALIKKGWNQSEIAEEIGISRPIVNTVHQLYRIGALKES